MPRQRKLGQEEKREASSLLKMKVNKKLLQQHLSSTTGRVVTLKDISNIQSGVNAAEGSEDLGALVTRLRESEGIVTFFMHIVSCFMILLTECRYI